MIVFSETTTTISGLSGGAEIAVQNMCGNVVVYMRKTKDRGNVLRYTSRKYHIGYANCDAILILIDATTMTVMA